MADITALRRQWILIRTLCARRGGRTLADMAREMGVSLKTIRRDLDLFRGLGFPLEERVGEFNRKHWLITSPANQPPLYFTFEEAIALYLGRRFLEPLAGTIFWQAAQDVFKKLRSAFTEQALSHLAQFECLFHQTAVGASDYSQRGELIDTLMRGMEESKAVHILYRSQQATEPAFRDVYPYGMAYHRGSLYLVAFDPQEAKIKHYKVDRIERVEVSPFPFQRPADFDLERHLSPSFGIFQGDGDVSVTIRFLPPVVRYVLESSWHPSQQLVKQPDGSLLADFSLSSYAEIKSWALSFGANAVVLGPPELRREMVVEVERMAGRYRTPERPVEGAIGRKRPRRPQAAEPAASRDPPAS
jgi:proteasome accessory factor B